MRVLILTQVFSPEIGGAGAVPESLATHLPAAIAVAAPRSQTPRNLIQDWAAFDRRFPFSVYRVPAFFAALSPWLRGRLPSRLRGPAQFAYNMALTRPLAAASLFRQLSHTPVDVLCINTLLPCYWLARSLARRYPKLRVIFYLHGEEVNDGPRRTKLDLLAQSALREADAVVTVSSFTRERAIRCGVAPEKITVIHNGVDVDRFCPGPKDSAIEQRFGLAGKRVLLCLARLDERKGQDTLIAAMPEILAAVPDAVLLLVGGGDDEPRLRALVTSLGLEEHIVFAGLAADDEIVAYYRTADVYVMPNRTTALGDTEGFGLTFLEAEACGKAVIGGRAGGVPDAIVDGFTGFLVDGTSTSAVAEACVSLLADPVLAQTLGQNGRTHASENTWHRQAQRFIELCEGLISTSGT